MRPAIEATCEHEAMVEPAIEVMERLHKLEERHRQWSAAPNDAMPPQSPVSTAIPTPGPSAQNTPVPRAAAPASSSSGRAADLGGFPSASPSLSHRSGGADPAPFGLVSDHSEGPGGLVTQHTAGSLSSDTPGKKEKKKKKKDKDTSAMGSDFSGWGDAAAPSSGFGAAAPSGSFADWGASAPAGSDGGGGDWAAAASASAWPGAGGGDAPAASSTAGGFDGWGAAPAPAASGFDDFAAPPPASSTGFTGAPPAASTADPFAGMAGSSSAVGPDPFALPGPSDSGLGPSSDPFGFGPAPPMDTRSPAASASGRAALDMPIGSARSGQTASLKLKVPYAQVQGDIRGFEDHFVRAASMAAGIPAHRIRVRNVRPAGQGVAAL